MKSVVFENFGKIEVVNIEEPRPKEGFSIVRVIEATLNPIDIFTIMGKRDVKPIPHIPGVEIYGEVIEGTHKGKRVIVYPRLFCGNCEHCFSEKEMLCTGEIFGVSTNGGFCEFCLVPDKNIFQIDSDISQEVASSLPVGALTAYHALKNVNLGSRVAVIGATGNTGMFSVQIAKLKGAEVFAFSRRKADWLKELGADELIPFEQISRFKGYFDVVVDPLGEKTFEHSIKLLKKGGKFITFGVLTGRTVSFDIFELYSKELSILGATGGSRKEMIELISIARKLKVKVWRKFKLEEIHKAIESMNTKDGKIGIVM